MRSLKRSEYGRLLGLPDIRGGRLASQKKWVGIWFRVEEEERDEIRGDNEGDEGGVDVPASKQILKLGIDLLEDGGNGGCHCCTLERDMEAYLVPARSKLGEVNSDSEVSPTVCLR